MDVVTQRSVEKIGGMRGDHDTVPRQPAHCIGQLPGRSVDHGDAGGDVGEHGVRRRVRRLLRVRDLGGEHLDDAVTGRRGVRHAGGEVLAEHRHRHDDELRQADDGDQLTDGQPVVQGDPAGTHTDGDDVDRADGLGDHRQPRLGGVRPHRGVEGARGIALVALTHGADHTQPLDDAQALHRIGGDGGGLGQGLLAITGAVAQRPGRPHRQRDHQRSAEEHAQSELPVDRQHHGGDVDDRGDLGDREDGHHHDLGGLVRVRAGDGQQATGRTFPAGDAARVLDPVGDRGAQVVAELLHGQFHVASGEPDADAVDGEQGHEHQRPEHQAVQFPGGHRIVDGASDHDRGRRITDEAERHPRHGDELPRALGESQLQQPAPVVRVGKF